MEAVKTEKLTLYVHRWLICQHLQTK